MPAASSHAAAPVRPAAAHGRHERAQRGAQPGRVANQPRHGHSSLLSEQADRGHGEPAHAQQERPHGRGGQSRHHAGAQHRRPQRELRADDRQADPAEHVQVRVGEPYRPIGIGRGEPAAAQDQPKPGPAQQRPTGRKVEPDGVAQAGGQAAAQPGPEHQRVHDHDHAEQSRAACDHRRMAAVHPGEHGQHAQVERSQPGQRGPLADRPGVQQRGGEVLAPHHDRVAHRPEQQQVERQPATTGDPPTTQQRDPAGHQVGEHDGGRDQVSPAAPTGDSGTGRQPLAGPRGATALRSFLARHQRPDTVGTKTRVFICSSPSTCGAIRPPRGSPRPASSP